MLDVDIIVDMLDVNMLDLDIIVHMLGVDIPVDMSMHRHNVIIKKNNL
jgi:hypothetical protein